MANELGTFRSWIDKPVLHTFAEGAGFAVGIGPIDDVGHTAGPFVFEKSKGSWQKTLSAKSFDDFRKNAPLTYRGHLFQKDAGKFFFSGTKGTLSKIGRVAFGAGIPGIGVLSVGHAGYKGFKSGGVFGAAWGMSKEAFWWGATDVAFQLGLRGATNPLVIGAGLFVAGHVASGLYAKGQIQKDLQARYRSLPINMAGNMDAFNTRSAATMRQRAERAIMSARGSMAMRNALGSESFLFHGGTRYR